MAKNELLKFAYGDKPNLVPFSEWEANPSVKTGFQAGIAKSAELNRVFAQGALAANALGEFVVEMTKEDVSLETDLYKAFKKALGAYVNANLADHVVTEAKLATSIDASKFTLKMRTLTTSERQRSTYEAGEIIVDSDEKKLYVGDGTTKGGVRVGGDDKVLWENIVGAPKTPKAYITEVWRNDESWYRVWSDGWIEQGGIYLHDDVQKVAKITFPKPFSKKPLMAHKTNISGSQTDSYVWYSFTAIFGCSSTNLEVEMPKNGRLGGFYWYACGF